MRSVADHTSNDVNYYDTYILLDRKEEFKLAKNIFKNVHCSDVKKVVVVAVHLEVKLFSKSCMFVHLFYSPLVYCFVQSQTGSLTIKGLNKISLFYDKRTEPGLKSFQTLGLPVNHYKVLVTWSKKC